MPPCSTPLDENHGRIICSTCARSEHLVRVRRAHPLSTCFGFTEAEVEDLLERAGQREHLDVVRRWYKGYIFGDTVVPVRSNRESGRGRPDVLIMPAQVGQPGVVMELARIFHHGAVTRSVAAEEDCGNPRSRMPQTGYSPSRNGEEVFRKVPGRYARSRRSGEISGLKVARAGRKTIEQALSEGLEQIEAMQYAAELGASGAAPIHAFVVAFDGKDVKVRMPGHGIDRGLAGH